MSDTEPFEVKLPFRPRARLLQLLGDQLIGSPRLAVFELVKNAYDADATAVVVTLDLRPSSPTITVTDDGEGMTLDTLKDIWLVPGDDHRDRERKELTRSPRFQRLPLGEKGLGRFAVHKLGNHIHLVTRATQSPECVVDIAWDDLIAKPFLEDAPVTIRTRKPELFLGAHTGTQITIGELRQVQWTRGEIRRLQRQITSISSPFAEPSAFQPRLEVPGREHWLSDVPDVKELLRRAIWTFTFSLDGERFSWTYAFHRIPGLNLEPRTVTKEDDRLKLPDGRPKQHDKTRLTADASTTSGIGPVTGQFYVYDRDRDVLRLRSDAQLLEEFLDENGGIRVYRDGIRVYNYGEPGDDWLGLDLRRVNVPTRRISRNIILGAINLSLKDSPELVEKTNREGFVENDACQRLRHIVLGALGALESERQIDKERIRALTSTRGDRSVAGIERPITQLRQQLDKKGIREALEPYIAKIETDYRDMQETLLAAGLSGLNLAVVFHEVERGVRALHDAIEHGSDPADTALQARDLMHLLEGFSVLLRRDSRANHSAFKLVDAARRFNVLRFRHHSVRLVSPLLDTREAGFVASYPFGLILGALNNLIDNSLYWLRIRWPDPVTGPSPRALYIDATQDLADGPAIVVADTGPGFGDDDPMLLVRPFFTRRPSGMGLGLYYANLAMELCGGQLLFPSRDELHLPHGFDGAAVALVFKGGT